MKKRELVTKIMTDNPVTITLQDSLIDAQKMMEDKKIRHLPVVDNQEIIGMLSYTDLMRVNFVDSYGKGNEQVTTTLYSVLTIEQVMIDQLVTVNTETTIREAAEILSKKEFHALPVIDNNGLVGIITTTDLIKYLLEQYH
ncbi:CBS domain-containing protein [Microscilla marina]|uniref:CBS domain protein n=1 Tax=Microscilla marina ATCC 23134 TaxID=313606 RepID=A1ZUR2_MICM2|nr:CBS domain-containing protein [Microscilla marina]EAY25816.1 CBS domain protein [Microscilla marina ATCC 23134]